MNLWGRIKCVFGSHDWALAREVHDPGTGFTDNPMDYESGGIDYHGKCTRCDKATVLRKRGVWIAPKWKGMQ